MPGDTFHRGSKSAASALGVAPCCCATACGSSVQRVRPHIAAPVGGRAVVTLRASSSSRRPVDELM